MIKTVVFSAILSMMPFLAHADEELDLKINYAYSPRIATTFEGVVIQDDSHVAIVLSDGSQWIVRNRNSEEALQEISHQWRRGDDIRIGPRTPEKYDGKFILKNVKNGQVHLADLDKSPSRAFVIEKIDKNGYAIVTADGLEWVTGWLGACISQHWRTGDRIIINKSSHLPWEDFLLINARDESHVWGSLVSWK